MPPDDQTKQGVFPKRPEPPRVQSGNKKGRYLLKDQNGVERDWQRVTTFIGTIESRYGLESWFKRNVAIGLTQKPHLLAKAASLSDPHGADKDTLNDICEKASEAAGSTVGSDTGTSLHSFTELADLGHNPTVPSPWDLDVAAYRQCLQANNVEINPEHVERTLVLDDFGIAGTLDRIVTINGVDYVADLKTGKEVVGFPHKICTQLALYAHADCLYDWDFEREPMPEVNQEWALVIHLPAGQATCKLLWFNIAAGWSVIPTIQTVKDWNATKDLVKPFEFIPQNVPAPTPTPPPALQAVKTSLADWQIKNGLLVDAQDSAAQMVQTFTEQIMTPPAQTMAKVKQGLGKAANPKKPASEPTVCADCGVPVTDKGLLEMSLFRHKKAFCVEHYNANLFTPSSA